jgi:hypothetical protein
MVFFKKKKNFIYKYYFFSILINIIFYLFINSIFCKTDEIKIIRLLMHLK